VLSPVQRALLERHLAAVRAETDPVAWEAAWRQGSGMSIEEATVEILDENDPFTESPRTGALRAGHY